MITKTLIGLIIVLIVTIAISYYMNKEGFDNAATTATTVTANALSEKAMKDASTQLATAGTGDISVAMKCYTDAEKSISDAINATYNALSDIKTKIADLTSATISSAPIPPAPIPSAPIPPAPIPPDINKIDLVNKSIMDIIRAAEYIELASVSLNNIVEKINTFNIALTDPLKYQITKMNDQSKLMKSIINFIYTKINPTKINPITISSMVILFAQFATEIPPYNKLNKLLILSTPPPTTASETTTIADDLLLLKNAATPIPAMTSPEVIVWPDNDNNTFRLEGKVINGPEMTVDIVKNVTSPYERMSTTRGGISVTPTRSHIWSTSKNMMTDKKEYYIVKHADTLSGILTPLGSFVYKKSGYENYWRNNRDRYGEDYGEGEGEGEDESRKPTLIYDEDGAYPKNENVDPDTTLSATAYEAIELQKRSKLLEDIQKTVRNEVLAARSTTPVEPGCDTVETELIAQGKEYTDTCYKGNKDTCYNDTEYKCPKNPDGSCPPIPDMTKFIKKDSVPCWGCNIDY